jgi:hypothetical protein
MLPSAEYLRSLSIVDILSTSNMENEAMHPLSCSLLSFVLPIMATLVLISHP